MKMPRDIDASDQFRALRILGYESLRQDCSHIRLTTTIGRLPTLSTKVLCSIFGTGPIETLSMLRPRAGNGWG